MPSKAMRAELVRFDARSRCASSVRARWLAWCVQSGHLEVNPEILAIVQGREIAAEVLDQFHEEDLATPDTVRAFHRIRLELRKLNARIEAVITGGTAGGTDGPTGLGRGGQATPLPSRSPPPSRSVGRAACASRLNRISAP